MAHYKLRFRQVHLDFHTSPHIPGDGRKFDGSAWQDALRTGHVDSITCFSKCHHGWSYHPTKVGKTHPHLDFDLLRAQMDASKEIGVNVPIYISAGVDDVMGRARPDWREITIDGCYAGWSKAINQAGFLVMCFNSPYLDYLCEQICEAVHLFPDCNGVFLDIIHQGECCCPTCLADMEKNALDAENSEDRKTCARAALERYYAESTAACRCENADMPVFHNSGHVAKGDRDALKYFRSSRNESISMKVHAGIVTEIDESDPYRVDIASFDSFNVTTHTFVSSYVEGSGIAGWRWPVETPLEEAEPETPALEPEPAPEPDSIKVKR